MPAPRKEIKVVLGSGSPRRQELLKAIFPEFEVRVSNVDEHYPAELQGPDIATFLSELKSDSFAALEENTLLITADTIVWLEGECIGKSENEKEAVAMLQKLSGKMHEVFTGITLQMNEHKHTFSVATKVFFKTLTTAEIKRYVKEYQPMDKAGAYGIQDWIGMVGVYRIEGDFYNVVGLPVAQLSIDLNSFLARSL
jgi:septum formation protein